MVQNPGKVIAEIEDLRETLVLAGWCPDCKVPFSKVAPGEPWTPGHFICPQCDGTWPLDAALITETGKE